MGENLDLSDIDAIPEDFQRLRNLWAEVIRVAIADAQMSGRNFSGYRKDAINWIFDDGRAKEVNSFVSICGLLDVSPEQIRARLRKMLGMRIS